MGFFESEVGVAVAATAALASPRVRAVMRRGAVYGLAGVLKAGDMAASAARGVAAGVRAGEAEEAPAAAKAEAARAAPEPEPEPAAAKPKEEPAAPKAEPAPKRPARRRTTRQTGESPA